MTPIHVGGTYEHVKTGNRYTLLAVAKDSKTLEDFVVYESQYENKVSKVWIRPLSSFTGEAKSPDGTVHPRFKFIPT
jgi:hypothetical protein